MMERSDSCNVWILATYGVAYHCASELCGECCYGTAVLVCHRNHDDDHNDGFFALFSIILLLLGKNEVTSSALPPSCAATAAAFLPPAPTPLLLMLPELLMFGFELLLGNGDDFFLLLLLSSDSNVPGLAFLLLLLVLAALSCFRFSHSTRNKFHMARRKTSRNCVHSTKESCDGKSILLANRSIQLNRKMTSVIRISADMAVPNRNRGLIMTCEHDTDVGDDLFMG
jgi:hypothetical protein